MTPSLMWMLGCTVATPDDRTCEEVTAEFETASESIRRCDVAADCGQVLVGTSCGCTRNWIANNDADTTDFYALLDEAAKAECDLGLESTCDCPATAGFVCDEHVCGWNYVDAYPYLPVCHAKDGDALSIDEVVLDGDELVVSVGYSGGCEAHDIVLCWPDQTFMESSPVQASLELFHDAHSDSCEAWIAETRRFPLAPLQEAWKQSYGSDHGEIVIHLGTATVDWKF